VPRAITLAIHSTKATPISSSRIPTAMAVARFRHSGSVQLATSSASRIGYESFRMRGPKGSQGF
jgi:hypothetical protein